MRDKKDKALYKKLAVDVAGFGLIIASPFLGWLPGPGGIPVFLAGVAILARNYDWAENLLQNFNARRQAFERKYLELDKKSALIVDILCLIIIASAALVIINSVHPLLKIISLSVGLFCLVILLLNQNRFDRLVKRLRSKS